MLKRLFHQIDGFIILKKRNRVACSVSPNKTTTTTTTAAAATTVSTTTFLTDLPLLLLRFGCHQLFLIESQFRAAQTHRRVKSSSFDGDQRRIDHW